MTDLIERLRRLALAEHMDLSTADEAADEIERLREAWTAERDCRACLRWQLHRHAGVMHCSSVLRCVSGDQYVRAGNVQAWERAPTKAGF